MAQEAGAPRDELVAGANVALRTTFGELVEGMIYGFDKSTNCLLLKEAGAHNGVATLRFLKAAYVSEIVSASRPPAPFEPQLPHVDLERCRKREERALASAAAEAGRVGEGVTKEAQTLFDSLHKTMPCRWKGKTIVVLGEVHVQEPYTPEASTADAEHKATLQRVQKVLSAERARLGI
mmetsp:Transcript_1356/g.3682  ORF Transcript_1356/g.3682 Transcript_1356/m.3682 type:complete len:179 (-) Transcript_1356:46-582(-)